MVTSPKDGDSTVTNKVARKGHGTDISPRHSLRGIMTAMLVTSLTLMTRFTIKDDVMIENILFGLYGMSSWAVTL